MNKNLQTQVTIVGAGAAGCCAAIALRKVSVEVLLLEKSLRRHDRFCGEFISGEATTSLRQLGIYEEVMGHSPTRVRQMSLYGRRGQSYSLPLTDEGLGLSRRALDSVLLKHAVKLGAQVMEGTFVESITPIRESDYVIKAKDQSTSQCTVVRSQAVIGAQGKRSNLDRALRRGFLARRSPYVGVKCHFNNVKKEDKVELYLFSGGYCGVVGIESDRTNICLLATERALRQNDGRPEKLIGAAKRENAFLAESMRDASALKDSLFTIGQVPFASKEQVANGVFMVGDSAGVMAPFLGVGVAGAMRSAIVCADLVSQGIKGVRTFRSAQLKYQSWWRRHYHTNQQWGHLASRLLCHPKMGEIGIALLNQLPAVGAHIYGRTRSRDYYEVLPVSSETP